MAFRIVRQALLPIIDISGGKWIIPAPEAVDGPPCEVVPHVVLVALAVDAVGHSALRPVDEVARLRSRQPFGEPPSVIVSVGPIHRRVSIIFGIADVPIRMILELGAHHCSDLKTGQLQPPIVALTEREIVAVGQGLERTPGPVLQIGGKLSD